MAQDQLEKLAREMKRQAKNYGMISKRASKKDSDYYFGISEAFDRAHSIICDAIKERDEKCKKYEAEKLRNLPSCTLDAVEEIRLDIVRHRATDWDFISEEAYLELIDYLRAFVLRKKESK